MDGWVVRISGVSAPTVGNRRSYAWVASRNGLQLDSEERHSPPDLYRIQLIGKNN
ncbi:MAG: hypothetical protein IJ607_00880 [Bacteroidaceae bacterium]|nr:hypothetical protein [Bacteroidaceae bacterium]